MSETPPLRWGVLGAANIAVKKVIPAMQATPRARVVAIASRDGAKARAAADALGIPRAHESYEALLDDPDVDAVYNPLPNHLHVPWSIRAAAAGKHVLCEKPLAMTAADARLLRDARDHAGVHVAEAFMIRLHPQWRAAKQLVEDGRIGALRLVAGHFSYNRRDPGDVRSRVEFGGGALLDIGCYLVMVARWFFGSEPSDVVAQADRDPELGVDRLTSGLLRFPAGQATFSCAGQLVPFQRVTLYGDRGRLEIEVPFNAGPDRPCRLILDDGARFAAEGAEVVTIPAADQYRLQAEHFAAVVAGSAQPAMPLEDSIANMMVIDALFRSAASGSWERPAGF